MIRAEARAGLVAITAEDGHVTELTKDDLLLALAVVASPEITFMVPQLFRLVIEGRPALDEAWVRVHGAKMLNDSTAMKAAGSQEDLAQILTKKMHAAQEGLADAMTAAHQAWNLPDPS